MSGIDKPKTFYWDACVYLAWLMEETSHGKQCMDALAQIVQENSQRKNIIVTSAITFIEVLPAKIGADREALFRKSFRTGDHIAYDVDAAIAMTARDLREKLLHHESGKNLSTPDAIHLATASIYKADVVFSFDTGEKDTKHLGLLQLSKDPRISGMEICKPFLAQPPLI